MPKKKRGGEKEKRNKKKCLNEREAVSYEQQISDNNRQLARLQSRNKELEGELDRCKRNLEELTEDRADVVAYLRRELENRLEEARELRDRLTALEQTRKEESAAFKKKEESMEAEYKAMESKLSAEVKLAAGKLNALEDWRLARLELMEKFETQEKEMAEQEERHKVAVHEAQKQLIVGKAKMQREMEDRLQDLCFRFSGALNLQIAEATQRAIRESIWLNQESELLEESFREAERVLREEQENCALLRFASDLFEQESRIVLRKRNAQRRTMEWLAKETVALNLKMGELEREKDRLLVRANVAQDIEEECRIAREKITVLEAAVEETRREREGLSEKIQEKEDQYKKIQAILGRAQRCVMNALQIKENLVEEDLENTSALKQELLVSLQEILGSRRFGDLEI